MKHWAILLALMLCLSLTAGADPNPGFEIKPYGYVKLDGSYDRQMTSHGNFVMWVPQPTYEGNDEQFNMTANQTRLGLNLKGRGYGAMAVSGKVEFDLYGSVTGATVAENKAMLQLRHAFFTVQKDRFRLVAGQTSDMIAPLNPSTLNYSVLWGCGNIGYRRPQISGWYTANPGPQTTMTLAAGFFRTIGTDLTPTLSLAAGETADGQDDGTDAGIPSIQGLWEMKYSWDSQRYIQMGVSGLWGRLNAETNLGQASEYESWAAVGHFMVSAASSWGISGEYYTGANLGSYFGGILSNSTIDGLECRGGWASTWLKVMPRVKLTAGFGLDEVTNEDLTFDARRQNRAVFGSVEYSLAPQIMVGLEVTDWETRYHQSETADNLRLQSSFMLSF